MKPDTPKFHIGQTVYHRCDDDAGIVMAIVYWNDHISYRISWCRHSDDEHNEIELATEKTFLGSGGSYDDKEGSCP